MDPQNTFQGPISAPKYVETLKIVVGFRLRNPQFLGVSFASQKGGPHLARIWVSVPRALHPKPELH